MFGLKTIKTFAAVASLALFGWAGAASAVTVDFYKITNNTTDISSELALDISAGTGGAVFAFSASGPIDLSVAEIYFDDQTPLFTAPPVYVSSTGYVNYSYGSASPGNLPGGSNVGFHATSSLSADAGSNAMVAGINPGESYTMQLNYATGMHFTDLLAALADGSFRIGLHVIGVADGTGLSASDSYVNGSGPSPVPLPAGGLLLMGALGGLGLVKRRRRKAA